MTAFLAPSFGAGYQSLTNQGLINAGGHILTYVAGSTTPQPTWTDSTQGTSNGVDIVLNSAGRPPQGIWLAAGVQYKFQVTDVNGNNVGPAYDFLSGINDNSALSASQWVASGLTPTFVSGISFTVAGDQTTLFQVNRRVQYVLGAGTFYGSVTASAFGSVTTVTVLPDVTNLDNTLSAVSVGLLTPLNWSDPHVQASFTPTISFGGASSGVVYGTRVGKYTRFGDIVFFYIFMSLSSKGSSTGTASVGNLPYAGAANVPTTCSVVGTIFTGLTGSLVGLINSLSVVALFQSSATGSAAITDTSLTDSSVIEVSGSYKV